MMPITKEEFEYIANKWHVFDCVLSHTVESWWGLYSKSPEKFMADEAGIPNKVVNARIINAIDRYQKTKALKQAIDL